MADAVNEKVRIDMDDKSKTAISTLNSLIETCNDGAQGFQTAAQELKDSSTRELFSKYARERSQFAEELRGEVRRLGGTPDEGGSVSGAAHRGWMNIKSAIAGKNDSAIIAEAERGEDVAVRSYKKALESDLPPQIRSTIQRQFTQVKTAHDRVRELEKSAAR
jgi:uncharacterized protein (TIGR02284 family)